MVGRAGRRVFAEFLPRIRNEIKPDILLLNGENLAGGFGITAAIYKQFIEDYQVDCITTGNHWHDNKEVFEFADHAERLTFPANMGNVRDEGMGLKILPIKSGGRFAVINVVGKAFMTDGNRSPFDAAARLLAKIPNDVKVRIVDVHAEATSEKQAMAH